MKSRLALLAALLGVIPFVGAGPGAGAPPQTQCAPAAAMPAATTPVAYWSTEARCAIVPAGPAGAFGLENFGSKFPGEAAVYMGIVHVAIYDAAVATVGGYRPYAITVTVTPKGTLRAKTGWNAWAAWRRAEGEWKPYGKANANVRPHVPRAIPHAWWTRLGKLPAPASSSPAAASQRSRPPRTRRSSACSRRSAWMRAVRRSSTPTTRHTWPPSPAAMPKNAGVAVGRARRTGRARQARKRRPGAQPDRRRPEPAARGTWRLATESLGARARPAPARRQAARARERFAAPPRRPQCAHEQGVRRRRERGRAPRARRQRLQDARADDPGALLDRSRPQAVERRHAPSRRRSGAGPRADGADAGHGARGRAATR